MIGGVFARPFRARLIDWQRQEHCFSPVMGSERPRRLRSFRSYRQRSITAYSCHPRFVDQFAAAIAAGCGRCWQRWMLFFSVVTVVAYEPHDQRSKCSRPDGDEYMTLRMVIVLACTLAGLSACVVEPYGRGGERGGGYSNSANGEHGDYYSGGGHGDDGQRDRH